MLLSPEQERVLDTIRREWDLAEVDIKLAEQVCNDIIVPAVKELRYGGRRLVDLVHKLHTDPGSDDVQKLLADLEFDCYRARHDAIDAATAKIAIQIEIMAESLGYEIILAVYPEYRDLALKVVHVREKIAESRGNREDRVKIYASVSAVEFPKLVESYAAMKSSEAIMVEMAKRGRQRDFFGKWGFWIGAIGLLAAAFGIWLAYHPPH